MRQKINDPEAFNRARKAFMSSYALNDVIPAHLMASMYATPSKAVLRAVYGGAWRAIAAWAWDTLFSDADRLWWDLRVKAGFVWLNEVELDGWDADPLGIEEDE